MLELSTSKANYDNNIHINHIGINGFRTYVFNLHFVSPEFLFKNRVFRFDDTLRGSFTIQMHDICDKFNISHQEVNIINENELKKIQSEDFISKIFGSETAPFFDCKSANVMEQFNIDGVPTWKLSTHEPPSSEWLSDQIDWDVVKETIRKKLNEYVECFKGVAFESDD